MPSKRNSFKYKVWQIVVSTPFEYFIMMLIVFNTLLLMMKVRIPPCKHVTLTTLIETLYNHKKLTHPHTNKPHRRLTLDNSGFNI